MYTALCDMKFGNLTLQANCYKSRLVKSLDDKSIQYFNASGTPQNQGEGKQHTTDLTSILEWQKF